MRGGEEKVSADLTEFWAQVERGRREGHYYAALFGWRDYDPLHLVGPVRPFAGVARSQRRGPLWRQFPRKSRSLEIPKISS